MVKKARRYDEGGDIREGPNENIGDDTRRRAMEAIRRRMAGEPDAEEAQAPTAASIRKSTRRPAPSRGYDESPAESKRLREEGNLANIRRLEREDKPLERVTPEEYMLPPGRMLRGLSALARSRAAPAELNTIRQAMQPRLGGPGAAPALPGPGGAPALPGPGGAAARIEGPGNMLRLGGPSAAARRARDRSERERSREEDDMVAEGGRPYKRGGKVKAYAKGGAVSASRRGDGIAQRGKTKGRVI